MPSHTTLTTILSLLSLISATPLSPRADPLWLTLPDTPALPSPIETATTPINGVNLWMQEYNAKAGGTPLVLLHGGLGYSAYFGSVISALQANNHVIAIDRRGHGRSTFGADDVFTFDMFAQDTFALLNAKGIKAPYNIVGWSDGGITTLAMFFNSTIAPVINKAFLFGTTAQVADSNSTFPSTAMYETFVTRCATEYAQLQPNADFKAFATKVGTLESTLPMYYDDQLAQLPGDKITIVAAEHDEAVDLDVPGRLHAAIPGSKLVTLKGVSHFAPVQDPAGFSKAVTDWLA